MLGGCSLIGVHVVESSGSATAGFEGVGVGVHALGDGDVLEFIVLGRGLETIIEDILLGVITDQMQFLMGGGADAKTLFNKAIGLVREGWLCRRG